MPAGRNIVREVLKELHNIVLFKPARGKHRGLYYYYCLYVAEGGISHKLNYYTEINVSSVFLNSEWYLHLWPWKSSETLS